MSAQARLAKHHPRHGTAKPDPGSAFRRSPVRSDRDLYTSSCRESGYSDRRASWKGPTNSGRAMDTTAGKRTCAMTRTNGACGSGISARGSDAKGAVITFRFSRYFTSCHGSRSDCRMAVFRRQESIFDSSSRIVVNLEPTTPRGGRLGATQGQHNPPRMAETRKPPERLKPVLLLLNRTRPKLPKASRNEGVHGSNPRVGSEENPAQTGFSVAARVRSTCG